MAQQILLQAGLRNVAAAAAFSNLWHCRQGQSRQGQGLGAQLWHSFARLWEGFQHIAASAYLAHLSAYTVFTTVIASLMYFEKSMVSNRTFKTDSR